MHNEKPPFEITNEILGTITQIAELVGQVNATQGLSTKAFQPMRIISE